MSKRAEKIYTYFLDAETEELADKEAGSIKYIDKKTFKNAVANGLKHSIAGRTRLEKKKDNAGKTSGTLIAGEERYILDSYKNRLVKGYIAVGDDAYVEYVGTSTLAIFAAAGILALLLIAGILLYLFHNNTIIAPVSTIEEVTEEEESDIDFELYLELPDGSGHFEGIVPDSAEAEKTDSADEDIEPYTGQAHLTGTMMVSGEAHTIVDYDADVDTGAIMDFELDFTLLDFEIQQGVYDGTLEITYNDGTQAEKTMEIIVTQNNGGTMEIGFSPDVTVDLSSGAITCDYETDKYDTHQTVVELVLVSGDTEYILATSDSLQPGEILTGMTLDNHMKSRLVAGQYDGYLRLSFYSGDETDAAASIETNIEVDIKVQ